MSQANLASLERDKYFLWRDLFGAGGVLFYGDKKIDRFLSGEWKRHQDLLRVRLEESKKAVPEKFPFLHALADGPTADLLKPKRHRLRAVLDTPPDRGVTPNLGGWGGKVATCALL